MVYKEFLTDLELQLTHFYVLGNVRINGVNVALVKNVTKEIRVARYIIVTGNPNRIKSNHNYVRMEFFLWYASVAKVFCENFTY